jgi:hypothetical protein
MVFDGLTATASYAMCRRRYNGNCGAGKTSQQPARSGSSRQDRERCETITAASYMLLPTNAAPHGKAGAREAEQE